MRDFLNKIILDNSIQSYLITAVIIGVVFLVKRTIGHYLATFIFRIFKKRWKQVDIASYKNLVAHPLGLFLAIFITIAVLDKLKFPTILEFEIYHITFKEAMRTIGTGIIIITFFSFLIKATDFAGLVLKDRYMDDEQRAHNQLIFFFKDFIKLLLGIVAIIMLLKYCFNYEVKSLVTGLSIVGAAIALALKENLENLIASFIIFFDKPFTTGDTVKVNDITGTIEKIGLRTTRIRSEEKTYISVPNSQMADSILDNLSERSQRRAILKLELDPAAKHSTLQEVLTGLKQIVNRDDLQDTSVFVTDITPTSIIVTTTFYTGPIPMDSFSELRQQIFLQAYQLLERLDVKTSGKATNVNIVHGAAPPPAKIF